MRVLRRLQDQVEHCRNNPAGNLPTDHHQNRASALRSTVAFTAVMLVAQSAFAYVPPGGFILSKMADRRANMNLVEVEAQAQTTWGQSSEPLEERIQLKKPARMRWQRVESDWAYVFRDGEAADLDNGAVTRRKVDYEPLVEVLMPNGQSQEAIKSSYVAMCQKLGIDHSLVSLQRFGSGVSFVLGSKTKDKASFWVDKDSFQPVRVIFQGEHQGKKGIWDVQFREFKDAMPRVIERYFDSVLVSRSELVNVSTTSKIPEGMFALPAAKRP